jgi:pseudouridine synthase
MDERKPERLHKIIASGGFASRRECERLIAGGRVSVNGHIITEPGTTAYRDTDRIAIDGEPVPHKKFFHYVLLHKPEGVLTTTNDPQGRPTVMDYIPKAPARLFPVGRLDADTSGLLLLTDDGALAEALTHPKYRIPKTYYAAVKGTPSKETLARFAGGLIIERRKTAPCTCTLIRDAHFEPDGAESRLRITLQEGRNRQIRRMCEAIGHPVKKLHRAAQGPLTLKDLPVGKWRRLTPAEVNELWAYVHEHKPARDTAKKPDRRQVIG